MHHLIEKIKSSAYDHLPTAGMIPRERLLGLWYIIGEIGTLTNKTLYNPAL